MKKRIVISTILAVISLGLAVFGYVILPEQVIIQFSVGASGNSTVPKLLALLISTILGIGGAGTYLFLKGNDKAEGKSLLVSIVGIGLSIVMIAVNAFA